MKRRVTLALLLGAASASAVSAEPGHSRAAVMPATALDVASVLDKGGGEDRRVKDRLGALAEEGSHLHELLLLRGRAYVKMARAGLLPVGGGVDALVRHASRLSRLRRALASDLARERAISEERIALSRRAETLDERRAVLEAEHAALARSHTAIAAAEEREAAFRRAFLGGGAPHTAVYGGDLDPVDHGEVSGGFGAQKGRLPFPIEGRVEIRPARRAGSDGPGLEMGAAAGATVRAVFPGRVAFADLYGDYGHAVIVDHGSGYYTVSGDLSAIAVRVGDELSSGDRLGTVGSGKRGPALYFEVRSGKATLDPGPWFGI